VIDINKENKSLKKKVTELKAHIRMHDLPRVAGSEKEASGREVPFASSNKPPRTGGSRERSTSGNRRKSESRK
jgi:hypothetical protein